MLIVPGRPSTDALTWWVMKTEGGRLTANDLALTVGGNAIEADIQCFSMSRQDDPADAGLLYLVATLGLPADTPFRLTARLNTESFADSRTLPEDETAPLTLAIGSCLSLAQSGRLPDAYPTPGMRSNDPIHLRILAGDQIYMDLSPESGQPLLFGDAPEPWPRYFRQWNDERFRRFITASPNMVMADDHEFWNDYPDGNVWQAFASRKLADACDRTFSLYQAGLNLGAARIARFGAPAPNDRRLGQVLDDEARTFGFFLGQVPVFFLDTRTRRTRYDADRPRIVPAEWMARCVDWLRSLERPGVLVLSQPLVDERVGGFQRFFHLFGDANLVDFDDDYSTLCDALFTAPHDVLVLSGDIHWSRVYRLTRSGTSRQIYEVISSPLARIPTDGSKTGKDTGDIKWSGPASGAARWDRIWDAVADETFTLCRLAPQPAEAGGAINVRWDAFGRRGSAPHERIGSDQFTLK